MFAEHTLEALRWMTNLLEKHQIRYQLSGGFAGKLYGSPRPLNDIDFDVPDDAFPILEPHLHPYLIYGPERFRDEKWDILLMTLTYGGQEIDVSGGTTARMTARGDTMWIESPSDFSSSVLVPLDGMMLHVIPPRDLAEYKSHLNGAHQAIDIDAALRYAEMHGH